MSEPAPHDGDSPVDVGAAKVDGLISGSSALSRAPSSGTSEVAIAAGNPAGMPASHSDANSLANSPTKAPTASPSQEDAPSAGNAGNCCLSDAPAAATPPDRRLDVDIRRGRGGGGSDEFRGRMPAPIRLTQRDMAGLRFVNSFGCVSVGQFQRHLGVGDFSSVARRVRALCDNGLLQRRRFPFSSISTLFATRAGCETVGDTLAPLTGLRTATARHDLMVVDAAMSLERQHACAFEPERRLRERGF